MLSLKRIFALGAVATLALASLPASATPVTDPNSGTWTYVFTIDTGVSFTVVNNGAIGSANGQTITYSANGAPAGYISDSGFVGTAGTDSNSNDEVEIAIQYTSLTDQNSLLVYTFVQDRSLWANLGDTTFAAGTDSINGVQYWLYDPNFDPISGTVLEGANYAFYNLNVPDPQCTSCSLTTTYAPAVVSSTPEPSSLILLVTGSAGALFTRFRRRL